MSEVMTPEPHKITLDTGYFENLLHKPKKLNPSIDIENFRNQLSTLSHYIQNNKTNKVSKVVEENALRIINQITDSQNSDISLGPVCKETYEAYGLFEEFLHPTFKAVEEPKFYFIDLFAGIGGFRIACQNNGGKCVFSSEWDLDAQKTYFHNFGEFPFGDITLQKTKESIPYNFDLLCAGFPCQAFSIAGYQKGFEDTRGTLFFDIATILESRRPKAFILENVKNLISHDEGRTFKVIQNILKGLGYEVFYEILNSMEHANIPQNRERIIIVGFDPLQVPDYNKFKFPSKTKLFKTIKDCIDYTVNDEAFFYRENSQFYSELKESMKDAETVYQWRRKYVRQNKSNVCPTLTANMGTGGHNVPLILTDQGIRKLTPKECLNFQGFPEKYEFPSIARSKQYKQAGNSVTVPLIEAVIKNMIEVL